MESESRRVAILGAGACGLLTAAYLQGHGFTVEVFDCRPAPVPGVSTNHEPPRTFFSALLARGCRAAVEAGVAPELLIGEGTGILQYGGIRLGGGAGGREVLLPYVCLGGEESAFVAAFLKAAQQVPGCIQLHFSTTVTHVDLAGRLLRVAQPGGEEAECRYDLLVGADDSGTLLWQAAERQVPGFKAKVEPSPQWHKVFDLDAHASVPMLASNGGALMWNVPAAGAARSGGHIFLAPHPALHQQQQQQQQQQPQNGRSNSWNGSNGGKGGGSSGSGSGSGGSWSRPVKGMLVMDKKWWAGLESPQQYAALLQREFEWLPEEYVAEIAAQLAAAPLLPTGQRVLCSQLHGPSMVLVGNSAKATSPPLGNGLNSAVEDAWVLNQVLLQSGCDLAALPELWTAARLADAHALVQLDAETLRRLGRGPLGRWDPLFWSTQAATQLRVAACRLGGGRWVAPPAGAVVGAGGAQRYSQVRAQLRRDDAFVGAAAGGLAAVLAAALIKLGSAYR